MQAASGQTFDVHNPSNGQLIGAVPDMGVTETQTAIEAAHEAFQTWKMTTAKER